MSTRANVIIKDSYDTLFFYRHSDGYPEGTMPSLNVFMGWLKSGKIRADAMQSAAWLIILGAIEYATIPEYKTKKSSYSEYGDMESVGNPIDWKAGSYEPTTGIHGDIEYLYEIDLQAKSIKCFSEWTDKGNGLKEVPLTKYAAKQ